MSTLLKPTSEDVQSHLIDLTRQLLDSINDRNWDLYSRLCDSSLTAFEPEACGHLVEGMSFHRYYFDQSREPSDDNTTMAAPHVRMLGDEAAIVSYVRLQQTRGPRGEVVTLQFEETRVWQMKKGNWKHVHFHRSTNRRTTGADQEKLA